MNKVLTDENSQRRIAQKKKTELMERCFECYAEFGLNNVGIKGLSEACGVSPANLYGYFNDLDDLIVQATEYCMSKVEDDFMPLAPKDADDLERFIREVPYWTAKKTR
ncbi:MAG: TetR/AcrR family transcriptional regulator [Eubacteriales bacterium]|nr:TetR/AcrR family transcriptional regulator [Eubacteriales bacterium]MDY4710014.1 TetR/AcrR family transcriptional regulator [Eubacteriales bacterium]MDY6077761.1 TetR/AcrR family transcriptional regulator [Eubacteriales bacterium]